MEYNLDLAVKLPFFPELTDDKINVNKFLVACQGLVNLVEELGTLWKPLAYDMTQNIQKIVNGNSNSGFIYIEDLLLEEKLNKQNLAIEGLVWLKRSVHLFLIFFNQIVDDKNENENLELVLESAYNETLAPHHDWFTRKMFFFFRKACPTRSDVLKILQKRNEDISNDVLAGLSRYCLPLNSLIVHLNQFYSLHFKDYS